MGTSAAARLSAIKKLRIFDQDLFTKVALEDADPEVCKFTIAKIIDQKILSRIVLAGVSSSARLIAIKKLINPDQKILAKVVLEVKDVKVRWVAVGKLINQEVLVKVSQNDKKPSVRKAAEKRLEDLNKT